MHGIFIALVLCVGFAAPAFADRVAFPPDNCTGTNPFMAFDGVATGGNTYCINGQSVLTNALLPGCNDGQAVTYEGGKFICKTVSTDTPPTCSAGQFLTYNGTSFSCGSTNVPTCQAHYVLTYNGSAFTCVPKSASVPTCASNQFLTYNGTGFQCAATQTLTIPNCPSGQVLTGSGGSLACVAQSSGGSGTLCGMRILTACDKYGARYRDEEAAYYNPQALPNGYPPSYGINIPCNGAPLTVPHQVTAPYYGMDTCAAPTCPAGYTGLMIAGRTNWISDPGSGSGEGANDIDHYITCIKN